jgi:hypothetical protein
MVPLAGIYQADFHVLREDRHPDPLMAKSDAG